MFHNRLLINLQEWFEDKEERKPRLAIVEFIRYLVNRGYKSFELELSNLIQGFTSIQSDQSVLPESKDDIASARARILANLMSDSEVYVSCLKKDNTVIFIDLEPIMMKEKEKVTFSLEIDIIFDNVNAGREIKEQLADDVMKCFGLTGSKDAIVLPSENIEESPLEIIKDVLTTNKPIDDKLFQRIKELNDREILRELKKRGSILESDLGEFQIGNLKPDKIKAILDYFSGEEHQLIDKKFAIVCKKNKEIIFLLNNRQDLENAKHLVCPKCSVSIGDESVLSYYERTETLKELIDGSRWMPLLIRDELLNAGVKRENIFTEVKYGQDEIDLLVYYRGRIFVIEAKDRPVSLNDAYKLSAKTSRLEKVISKSHGGMSEDEIIFSTRVNSRVARQGNRLRFIPVVISNYDIAQDAQELLKDTKENSLFLDNATEKLSKFINELINEINKQSLNNKIKGLVTSDAGDSISNLASFQVQYAFRKMLTGE